MSAADTIRDVESGVADARLALGVIDEGLQVAATVADEVDRAWLSMRTVIRVLLVLALIGLVVAALRRARHDR